MITKFIVLIFIIGILGSLGSALFYLARERTEADARHVVQALTWRIALSLILFFLLMLAYLMGWIHPHAI
ncbi:MAG: twin transmembrane helix small protein [Gammaproteobacteria bacterium]|nr:twin transmembrane helix small protein [Gammaproteobacteria bacterium]